MHLRAETIEFMKFRVHATQSSMTLLVRSASSPMVCTCDLLMRNSQAQHRRQGVPRCLALPGTCLESSGVEAKRAGKQFAKASPFAPPDRPDDGFSPDPAARRSSRARAADHEKALISIAKSWKKSFVFIEKS